MRTVFLFDVDGVIVRGPRWSRDVQSDWGIAPDALASFFARDFESCIIGEHDLADALAPWMARWGHPGKTRAFMEYWFEKDAQVDWALLERIAELRSHGPCYLATNQERHRAGWLMERLGLSAWFSGLFASCALGAAKPSARFFAGVTARLEIALETLEDTRIFFMDDLEKNVVEARRHGWISLPFRGPGDLDGLFSRIYF